MRVFYIYCLLHVEELHIIFFKKGEREEKM